MACRALSVTTTVMTAVLAACGSTPVDNDDNQPDPGLAIVSGDGQKGMGGEALGAPLVVRLRDAAGQPVVGATIGWFVLGGGKVTSPFSVTDAQGIASTTFILGVEGIAQAVEAWVQLPGPENVSLTPPFEVTFGATITPTTSTAAAPFTWSVEQLPTIAPCANPVWSSIWAASATEVFMVGGCGTIRHLGGSGWETHSSGTTQTLFHVWGRSASDVFAVGDTATVLHYDGATWTPMTGVPRTNPRGIWGAPAGELFVATVDSIVKGHIWRHDGTQWAIAFNRICPLGRIWGSSPSDVWAVGVGGLVHYDGSSWTDGGCGVYGSYDVAGSGSENVYAVGATIDFSRCTRGGGCPRPAVVSRYDGNAWSTVLTLQRHAFAAVWVGDGGEAVVTGGDGLILHFDGSRWRREPSGTTGRIVAVTGAVGTSLWAITSDGFVLHGTRALP